MESAISTRVSSALRKNPYLDHSNFTHEIHGSRVVLKGSVPSFFEKQMAQESLRPIEEICEIVNELEVMIRTYCVDETQ